MKPRKIRTSKILLAAVVSSVGVGCNQGAADKNVKVEAAAPPAPAAAPVAPKLPAVQDPALLTLSGEITSKTREEAFAALEHFRPLCDRDGFPLVGNVLRKTPGDSYKASTFCSDLRERQKK
mgnify:CR=1 FL=1